MEPLEPSRASRLWAGGKRGGDGGREREAAGGAALRPEEVRVVPIYCFSASLVNFFNVAS